MKKIRLLLTAALASVSVALNAQSQKVTGTVTDASSGEGVPFASVMVKGTMTGVNSDADGKYSIPAPSDGVLVFSFMGYKTAEVSVNGRAVVNVRLEPDSQQLEETVVVGYGSGRKISSLVGTVTTVKSESIKNAPSSSALDMLQGQVAGMQVLSSSGVAGDNAVSIKLHGVGSIGGNTSSAPLYVIDGIPSSSSSIMAMNPNDIQSISILKDASATSIYGSRAANGVIYISTKGGSYNEKATVTVRSQYGVSTLADMSLYKNMMSSDELADFWIRSGIHSADWVQKNLYDEGYTANTKWYNYLMDLNNPQYQNDITIEGGGKKAAYLISGSQFHQKGFTPGNYYDRYTVRSNVQAHPKDWLKVGMNLNLSLGQNKTNGNWGSTGSPSNYTYGGLCYLILPFYSPLDENGNEEEVVYSQLGLPNPDYYAKHTGSKYNKYSLNGNFFVEIEPIKNLKIVSRTGADGYVTLRNGHADPSYIEVMGGSAYAIKSTGFSYTATMTNTIEYSFDINDIHKISVLAGHEGVTSDYQYYYAQSKGQTDDRQELLQQGTSSTYAMSESNSSSKFLSFFGHADYSLFDKYIVDATIRNDAVSRFGADKRNAMFWSAGARWNAKKESFLKDISWLNELNVKVSYGTQGNAAFSSNDYPSLGLITNSGQYSSVSSRYVSQPANPELTWEQQALFTAGFSGRVFNRLDFEIEYYLRKTTDMLMEVPNPYTTGFTEVNQNVGALQNQGVDITLGVDILRSRDYYLHFNTTFGYNAQKITELFDGRERWEVANTGIAYVVGNPVSFYFPIYAGVDPEDGLPMWYVPGDDKDVTTKNETTKTFDSDALSQNTGKYRYPPVSGGFSLSGGWKGFSVQADFSYVLGKYLLNNDAYFYANPYTMSTNNQSKAVTDFWTPENTDAKYPAWSKGVGMQFDSHLLENASFLRLKNLQVGYSLPKKALDWSNGVLKSVKVTFTGRNILTFTKYSGIDPEVDSNLTYGIAGNSKQFLGGLEIAF